MNSNMGGVAPCSFSPLRAWHNGVGFLLLPSRRHCVFVCTCVQALKRPRVKHFICGTVCLAYLHLSPEAPFYLFFLKKGLVEPRMLVTDELLLPPSVKLHSGSSICSVFAPPRFAHSRVYLQKMSACLLGAPSIWAAIVLLWLCNYNKCFVWRWEVGLQSISNQ